MSCEEHSNWTWEDEAVEADLLRLNVGKCQGQCDRDDVARTEHGPRAYIEKESYWLCGCCAEQYESYWDEMWSDYYSGLL